RRKLTEWSALKTCHEVIGGCAEVWEQGTDVVRREDRGQQAALLTPPAAFGEEKPTADQRPRHPGQEHGAHVVGSIRCKHMPHTRRIVDEHGIDTEQPSARARDFESVVGENLDTIALCSQQMT